MTPPYSKKNMDAINTFFNEDLKLPKEIKCNYAYLDKGDMVLDFEQNEIIADDINRKLESSPLEEWAIDSFIADKKNLQYFDIVSTDMARVAKRMKTDNGIIEATYLHGNCVPGQRRMYVTVDGVFQVCEKIGETPILGDYKYGYNYDNVYKLYFEDYVKYFEDICKDCWARSMCSICYERTMDRNGVIPSIEKSICNGSRRIIRDLFINYYRLLEIDRDVLAESLEKYEFS